MWKESTRGKYVETESLKNALHSCGLLNKFHGWQLVAIKDTLAAMRGRDEIEEECIRDAYFCACVAHCGRAYDHLI